MALHAYMNKLQEESPTPTINFTNLKSLEKKGSFVLSSPCSTPTTASPGISPVSSRTTSPLALDTTDEDSTFHFESPEASGGASSWFTLAMKKLLRVSCCSRRRGSLEGAGEDAKNHRPTLSRCNTAPVRDTRTDRCPQDSKPAFNKSKTGLGTPQHRSSCALPSIRRSISFARMTSPDDDAEKDPTLALQMYTVPLLTLLEMREALPHETLKAQGRLRIFSRRLGKAVYVSHEWVSKQHPDPKFEKLGILQDAVKMIMSELDIIPPDAIGGQLYSDNKGIQTREFRRPESLYFWYDYFSCPQLPEQNIRKTVASCIPQYIARSDFFFALCPAVVTAEGHTHSPSSWAKRGWCRFERAVREMSGSWILVQGPRTMEVLAQPQIVNSYGGAPGEGNFAEEVDKALIAEVLPEVLREQMMSSLRAGDVVAYRVHLNLQSVLFRGLEGAKHISDVVPGFEPSPTDDGAEHFLFQNGFQGFNEVDAAGWSPLCYGCLSGDVRVVQALLGRRADPDTQTSKPQELVNLTAWNPVTSICAFFHQNAALRLLIEARARVDSGWNPPISAAATTDNAEGIRVLCEAGNSPTAKNSFGMSPLEIASGAGAVACMDELVGRMDEVDTSRALHFAMWYRGGAEEVISRLISVRADLDGQLKMPAASLLSIGCANLSLQHRLGRVSTSTRIAYHSSDSTPLMLGVLSGQHAGVLALVKMGARLDLKNSRKRTASDMALEVRAPEKLQEALL
ncbi:ANK2 [Symbiodinium sp. CCMP2456]|nr:ANK2 [Symbiodinium sp. CCMP2456]